MILPHYTETISGDLIVYDWYGIPYIILPFPPPPPPPMPGDTHTPYPIPDPDDGEDE